MVDVELELILLAVEEEAEAGPVVARPQRLGQQPVALQDLRPCQQFFSIPSFCDSCFGIKGIDRPSICVGGREYTHSIRRYW